MSTAAPVQVVAPKLTRRMCEECKTAPRALGKPREASYRYCKKCLKLKRSQIQERKHWPTPPTFDEAIIPLVMCVEPLDKWDHPVKQFDEVVLNRRNPRIAAEYRTFGAITPFRQQWAGGALSPLRQMDISGKDEGHRIHEQLYPRAQFTARLRLLIDDGTGYLSYSQSEWNVEPFKDDRPGPYAVDAPDGVELRKLPSVSWLPFKKTYPPEREARGQGRRRREFAYAFSWSRVPLASSTMAPLEAVLDGECIQYVTRGCTSIPALNVTWHYESVKPPESKPIIFRCSKCQLQRPATCGEDGICDDCLLASLRDSLDANLTFVELREDTNDGIRTGAVRCPDPMHSDYPERTVLIRKTKWRHGISDREDQRHKLDVKADIRALERREKAHQAKIRKQIARWKAARRGRQLAACIALVSVAYQINPLIGLNVFCGLSRRHLAARRRK